MASATPLPIPFPYLNHHLSTYSPHIHLCRPLHPNPKHSQSEARMQYNCPTFELPSTVPKRRYQAGVVVETTLHVWVFSDWRGARGFAEWFLRAGFAHLPAGSPVMFRLEEVHPNSSTPLIGLTITITNRFDAYYLPGKVFWCGCEFIAFTTHNIFTNFDCIFPTRDGLHSLPYYIGQDDMEREQ